MLNVPQKIQKTSLVVLCSLLLSACSVGMALDGQKGPDLSVVKKGAHRTDVELQLGPAVKADATPNEQVTAVYLYEVGREASPGRAVAHGVMDVLTLGIWEVVGTPVEALKGDKLCLIITYDKDGRVISAKNSKWETEDNVVK